MTRTSGVSIVSTGILFTKSLTYRILKKTGSWSCSSSAVQKIDTGLRGWCLRALAMCSCNRPFQSCGLLWWEEYYKVEKILKCILDSIPSPSPSVKIQIMVGKVCLRFKGKTLLGLVNKLLKKKVCWHCPAINFPDNDLNFHRRWRWWDRIQAVS